MNNAIRESKAQNKNPEHNKKLEIQPFVLISVVLPDHNNFAIKFGAIKVIGIIIIVSGPGLIPVSGHGASCLDCLYLHINNDNNKYI